MLKEMGVQSFEGEGVKVVFSPFAYTKDVQPIEEEKENIDELLYMSGTTPRGK
jgi:hypothetical protein